MPVQRAACESSLPPDVRHVVMVMCHYADHKTASGMHSQATLARLSGLSERHVRGILAELSRPESRPVRIDRRARFRPDGRGRTSDEWTMVLVADQPAHGAGESETTNRQDVPVERPSEPRLTGTPRTTNRHATSDQPAHGAGDPLRDPFRDPHSKENAREQVPKKRSKSTKLRTLPWPADFKPTEAHRAFAAEHGLDVELERIACCGHYDGQVVASPNGRFTTWLANQVRWGKQRGHGRGRSGPPQPNGGYYKPPIERLG